MFYYLEERCKNLLCLSELSEKAKVFKIEKLKKTELNNNSKLSN